MRVLTLSQEALCMILPRP